MSPAVNTLVGGGSPDFYNYDDQHRGSGSGSLGAMVGSAADYLPGHGSHDGNIHTAVAAILVVAIGSLVLFQVGGFRAMVAVGR